jgi:hypothetical protein
VPRLPAPLWFALLSAVCAGARAEAQAVSIDWQAEGARACTKPATAEAEVARLAGTSSVPTQFWVRCQALDDDRQRCVVRIAARNAQTERELASCEEAREAAILIMAMAMAGAAPPPADERAHAPKPPPRSVGQRDTRWLLALAALVDHRTLPRVGFGPALGVSFALHGLRLGLAARYLPPCPVPDLPPGVEAQIDWFAGALSPAWLWRFGPVGVGPRAELELGALRGRARGVEAGDPTLAFWIAASAGAELEVWLHARLAVQLLALAGVPLSRPRFGFEDDAPFYTAPSYFVRGTLGLMVRIDARIEAKD